MGRRLASIRQRILKLKNPPNAAIFSASANEAARSPGKSTIPA
jgi:hypothetical protein